MKRMKCCQALLSQRCRMCPLFSSPSFRNSGVVVIAGGLTGYYQLKNKRVIRSRMIAAFFHFNRVTNSTTSVNKRYTLTEELWVQTRTTFLSAVISAFTRLLSYHMTLSTVSCDL